MKPENGLNFMPEPEAEMAHAAEFDVQQSDIFEEFGNIEITAFGMTASLKDFKQLAETLCPVPPEQRTPEASARFGAKLLQDSGVELPDRYANLLPVPETKAQSIDNHQAQAREVKPATKQPALPRRAHEREQFPEHHEPPENSEQKISVHEAEAAEIVSEQTLTEPIEQIYQRADAQELPSNLQELQAFYTEVTELHIQQSAAATDTANTTRPTTETVNKVYQMDSLVEEEGEVIVNEDLTAEEQTIIRAEDQLPEDQFLQEAIALMATTGEAQDLRPEALPEITVIKAQTEFISEEVTERFDLSEEVTEHVEQTVAVLPPEVREQLLATIQESEPEVVETVETLVVQIAQAAGRLHELAVTDQAGTEEAIKIEEILLVWYEELCEQLGLEASKEQFAQFILLIKSEAFEQPWNETSQRAEEGVGTHEFKLRFLPLYNDISLAANQLRYRKLGHYLVVTLAT